MEFIKKLLGITAIEKTLQNILRDNGPKSRKQHRKHKLHTFMKVCPDCGQEYKGNIGLGKHKAFAHSGRTPKLSRFKKCSEWGCIKDVHSKGLCATHYARHWYQKKNAERAANVLLSIGK